MSEDMTPEEAREFMREQARSAGQDGEPVKEEGGAHHDYDIPMTNDPEDEGKEQAIWACLIYQTPDGTCVGTADLSVLDNLKIHREATLDDIHRGATEVAKDVQVLQTSHATVKEVMEMSQRIAQAQANQRVAQQVSGQGKGPGPGGLHVPGS